MSISHSPYKMQSVEFHRDIHEYWLDNLYDEDSDRVLVEVIVSREHDSEKWYYHIRSEGCKVRVVGGFRTAFLAHLAGVQWVESDEPWWNTRPIRTTEGTGKGINP